jgi:hypothetical protein
MRKFFVHIKLRNPANAQLALDTAKFIGVTAELWSAGVNQLAGIHIWPVSDLQVEADVTVDVPMLPSTSTGLSIVGQQWFEDQLDLQRKKSELRAERARKAAAARWGNGGDQ